MLTEVLNKFSADAAALFNPIDFRALGGKLLVALIILLVMRLTLSLGFKLIDHALAYPRLSGKVNFDEGRAKTMTSILKSVLRYTVYFVAIITILDKFGVPVIPVLSAAGILGLAVAFGAQNLVRDIITGFFILLENQYSIGEYILTDGGIGGIVEELGLRVTKLRDFGGQLHIIPNGKITMVTNHNRGSMRALVEVRTSYEENVDRVISILNKVAEGMSGDYKEIITSGPNVLGIWSLEETGILFRIVTRTKPMEQWGVEMEIRRRIKNAFDEEGIAIPHLFRVAIVPPDEESLHALTNARSR